MLGPQCCGSESFPLSAFPKFSHPQTLLYNMELALSFFVFIFFFLEDFNCTQYVLEFSANKMRSAMNDGYPTPAAKEKPLANSGGNWQEFGVNVLLY